MTPNNGAFNSVGEIYSLKKFFWTNNMQRGAKIVPIQFDEFFQSEHNYVTSTQINQQNITGVQVPPRPACH